MKKNKLLIIFLVFLPFISILSCKNDIKDDKRKDGSPTNKKTFEITSKDGKKISFNMIKIHFADNITLGKEGEEKNPPHTCYSRALPRDNGREPQQF